MHPAQVYFAWSDLSIKEKKIHSSSTVVKIPGQLLIMKLFPL